MKPDKIIFILMAVIIAAMAAGCSSGTNTSGQVAQQNKATVSETQSMVLPEEQPALFGKVKDIVGNEVTVIKGAAPNEEPLSEEAQAQQNNHLTIHQGRPLEDEDEQKRNKCAVLGSELANTLTDGNPSEIVGRNISINSRKFEVVGIYNRVGDTGGMMSYDDSAFISYSVGEKYLLGTRANPVILVQATGLETVQPAIDDITNILNETHRMGGADQFRVLDAGSRLVAAQESARTMSLLLLAVAVVVLIVSGIGIMNVMFVTVKERTREIGTLKAIGARKREILGQFLIEAVVISLVGGVLGVIMGFIAVPLLKYFELPALPSVSGIILGLTFSVITGVFFGFYPAWRAAELNPIDALRYE